MSRIKIENFAPIIDSGWIDLTKVTLFVGEPNSGKSMVTKFAMAFIEFESTYICKKSNDIGWVDLMIKGLRRNDLQIPSSSDKPILVQYKGDRLNITYDGSKSFPWTFEEKDKTNEKYEWITPMYIPSQRNMAAMFDRITELDQVPHYDSVLVDTFLFGEYWVAKESLHRNGPITFQNVVIKAEDAKNAERGMLQAHHLVLNIDGTSVPINEASDGLQFAIPLYLVLKNSMNESLQEYGKPTLGVVELPELGLSPAWQEKIIQQLLAFAKIRKNQLILTSNSPYTIGFLSFAIKANEVSKVVSGYNDLEEKLNAIVPYASATKASDVTVYEFENGFVKRLPAVYGIPSDKNKLNQFIAGMDDTFEDLIDLKCDAKDRRDDKSKKQETSDSAVK